VKGSRKRRPTKRRGPRLRIPVAPPGKVHGSETAYKREKGKLRKQLREELGEETL